MEPYFSHLRSRILIKSVMNTSGCLEWQGAITQAGYGQISVKRGDKHIMITAHRAHWIAMNGEWLPRDVFVCHKCDNPLCVNLDHLFLGSAKDNMEDMIRKGRWGKTRRYATRECRYSREVVEAVRKEVGSNKDIALKYGMSVTYVYDIRRGKAKRFAEHVVKVDKRRKFTAEQIEGMRSFVGDWRKKAHDMKMSEEYAYQIRRGYERPRTD